MRSSKGDSGPKLRLGTLPFEHVLEDELAETRALLKRLEANLRANPERLSVANINQAMVRVLTNQALLLLCFDRLLDALAAGGAPAAAKEEVEATEAPGADAAPVEGGPEGAAEKGAQDASPAACPLDALESPEPVGEAMARRAVCAFDNQENLYEKGLDKLKRWSLGGTPIQMRGDLLFLRAGGCRPDLLLRLVANVTEKMGFSRRLGSLAVAGVEGEVWLYDKG